MPPVIDESVIIDLLDIANAGQLIAALPIISFHVGVDHLGEGVSILIGKFDEWGSTGKILIVSALVHVDCRR